MIVGKINFLVSIVCYSRGLGTVAPPEQRNPAWQGSPSVLRPVPSQYFPAEQGRHAAWVACWVLKEVSLN